MNEPDTLCMYTQAEGASTYILSLEMMCTFCEDNTKTSFSNIVQLFFSYCPRMNPARCPK